MTKLFVAAVLAALAGSASAETLIWRFDFFEQANFSYDWIWFGDELGRFEGEIVSTRLVFTDYVVEGDVDASEFHFGFAVPVLGGNDFIGLSGADIGWSGTGPVSYTLETDAYNGEIRQGRFGAELTSCSAPPCPGIGTFQGGAYIEFTVEGERIRPDPIFYDGFNDIFE